MSVASGKYLLEGISILQCMILMILNDSSSFKFADLKQKFEKLADHIPSQLIPLCKSGAKQILVKNPPTENFLPTDVFTLNQEFSGKKKKITFNTLHKREINKDIEDTISKVLMDRQLAIESNIVRLMKERKQCSHRDLVNKVIDVLKLPLTAKDIAKCVDDLIAKDYLARNEDDPQMYDYLA